MHPAGPFQKSDGSARLQWDLPRSRWQNLVARPFGWIEERQKPASYKSTDLPIQNCSQSHLCAYAGAHTREICLPSVPQRTLETYPFAEICAPIFFGRLASRLEPTGTVSEVHVVENSRPQGAQVRVRSLDANRGIEELDEGIATGPSSEAQMSVSRIIAARRFARRTRGRQQLC